MIQEFNRSKVRELTTEIQKSLNEIGARLGVEISLGSTTFTADQFTTKMKVRMISEAGSVVISDATHGRADHLANMNGVSFESHFIGSIWKMAGKPYKVLEVNTKRRTYPVLMLDIEYDRRVKCGWSNFRVSTELCSPSQPDFITWLMVDPDSDAVRESDVEIYDKVDEWFNLKYSEEELNFFYEPINALDEMDKLTKECCIELYLKFKVGGLRDAAEFAAGRVERLSSTSKKRSRK